MFSTKLLQKLGSPPHYVDNIIQYKNFSDEFKNGFMIGKLTFLRHRIGNVDYLKSSFGDYEVWISVTGESKLKGQLPVRSIEITGWYDRNWESSVTITDALIDKAKCGETYVAKCIGKVLTDAATQPIKELTEVISV